MKTTLAILGIFAAAVLATSFVASGYALSQTLAHHRAKAKVLHKGQTITHKQVLPIQTETSPFKNKRLLWQLAASLVVH